MKKIAIIVGLFCSTLVLANNPKISVQEKIKSELIKANFVQNVGAFGDVLVELRVDEAGNIFVEDVNSDNDQLASKFVSFVENIKLETSNIAESVLKIRFVFRVY